MGRDYRLHSMVKEALLSDSPMTLRCQTRWCYLLNVSQSCPSLTQLLLTGSSLVSSCLIFFFLIFISKAFSIMRTTEFVAAKHHSDFRLLLRPFMALFCLADRVFHSSPQFCPILTTLLYPRVISTSLCISATKLK